MKDGSRKRKSSGRRISFGHTEIATFKKNEAITPSKERITRSIQESPISSSPPKEVLSKTPQSIISDRRSSLGLEEESGASSYSEFFNSSLIPNPSDDDSILMERPSVMSSWTSKAKANPILWEGNDSLSGL